MVARVGAGLAGAFFAVALVAVVFFAAAFLAGAFFALEVLAEVALAGARPDEVLWLLEADARPRDGWSAREREGAAGREAMVASVPTNTFSTVRHTRHTRSCREESARSGHASTMTGTIMGLRRWEALTHLPTARLTRCCSS